MPMKMSRRQWGWPVPELHHFLPFRTTCSPSMRAVACMLVASEEATSGSVMQNAERISPARSGFSQRCFCAAEPYFTSTSMLPVSGALQLKTSGAIEERPVISARGAYSTLVRPAPYSWSGRNKFHRPAARALAFKVSMTAGCFQWRQSGRFCNCAKYSGSAGRTYSCMKAERR